MLWLAGAPLAAQPAGVAHEWEIRQTAEAVEKQARALTDVLGQLRPAEWVAQGAPEQYIEQGRQVQQFNSYLARQARELAEQPEKLTVVLDTFLRLDHLHSVLDSLAAGVRRYQNPALADLLSSAISQNTAHRERLKEYTRQLAEEREKEWEVAHREAQRCREGLAKRPPAAAQAKKSPPGKPAAPPANRP